jgi:hypothetical protein
VEVRFFTPVQTNPGAHIAFYTMGTSSFLGVKQLGLGVNLPPPSSAEVKGRIKLYFCASLAGYRMNFTSYLHLYSI